MKTITVEQLELGTDEIRNAGLVDARACRQQRARWWFQKMRTMVTAALPAKPAPTAPPEQNYLPFEERLTYRPSRPA